MNLKKITLAVVASSLVMFTVAGLWHQVILPQFYQSETQATHEGTGILFISYFILSLFMVYFYTHKKEQIHSLKQGFYFGAIIGLFWVFPHELAMAGAHGEPLGYVIKNGLWHLVEQSFGGCVIAWVFAKNPDLT